MKAFTSSKNFPWSVWRVALLVTTLCSAVAQRSPEASPVSSNPDTAENADHIAKILAVSELFNKARMMREQAPCGSPATIEELSIKQDIVEATVEASLEVDGVLAELDNERAQLYEISSVLQARRDRTVNLANAANLITGTGLGIAVNGLQFSSSTANIGNGLGVASGIGATVLSIVGIHLQRGPQQTVGRVPNMLAPLFGRQAALNSYYPELVLEYLRSVPPGESAEHRSRIDQLMAEWIRDGRLGSAGSPKAERQIARLTSSLDDRTKLSIQDISDRMAMLGDVTGRVGLIKRDLAALMLSVRDRRGCAAR